jgi:hypothetical protein
LIFKGGTSLEKLRLIQRFSEDLDLLITKDFGGNSAASTGLRAMCETAATEIGAQIEYDGSGGKVPDRWKRAYLRLPFANQPPQQSGVADANGILRELGQTGGRHPSSTIIEKLFRVNNFAVREKSRDDIHGWPRIGRQCYDIWALLGSSEVLALLADSAQSREVLADCLRVSESFGTDEPLPLKGFASCYAFDPKGSFAERLRAQHDAAMKDLYYGSAPHFASTLAESRRNLDRACNAHYYASFRWMGNERGRGFPVSTWSKKDKKWLTSKYFESA